MNYVDIFVLINTMVQWYKYSDNCDKINGHNKIGAIL